MTDHDDVATVEGSGHIPEHIGGNTHESGDFPPTGPQGGLGEESDNDEPDHTTDKGIGHAFDSVRTAGWGYGGYQHGGETRLVGEEHAAVDKGPEGDGDANGDGYLPRPTTNVGDDEITEPHPKADADHELDGASKAFTTGGGEHNNGGHRGEEGNVVPEYNMGSPVGSTGGNGDLEDVKPFSLQSHPPLMDAGFGVAGLFGYWVRHGSW